MRSTILLALLTALISLPSLCEIIRFEDDELIIYADRNDKISATFYKKLTEETSEVVKSESIDGKDEHANQERIAKKTVKKYCVVFGEVSAQIFLARFSLIAKPAHVIFQDLEAKYKLLPPEQQKVAKSAAECNTY